MLLAAVTGLLVGPVSLGVSGTWRPSSAGSAHVQPDSIATNYTLVSYRSSVDGKALSFLEWLPHPMTNTSKAPLAVFLHGLGFSGLQLVSDPAGPGIVRAAMTGGFALISLNTRTNYGFYVNSPFTGPQEQDVLDAVAREKSRLSVTGVYLFGMSMGSMGTWSIVGNHKLAVAGMASIATCDDSFTDLDWRLTHNLSDSARLYLRTTGGWLPNQSAQALGETLYLSAGRLHTVNYSNIRVYAVAGGADNRCPNNPALSGYQDGNSTFVSSSCVVATGLGEPANCTIPFTWLAGRYPAQYHFRYVYEPSGGHTLGQLNAPDLFRYWLNQVTGGIFWANPGGVPYHHT